MTPADALADAIRGRLVAGRPAPLPRLGTLVRRHVPARVETRPDGSRVLLPPGETVGLAPGRAQAEPLAAAFAEARGVPPDHAEAAFADAMDQVEARLAATGEVHLPGVGRLRRTSGSVVLRVEPGLLAAVNQAYDGLPPVAAPARTDGDARPTTGGLAVPFGGPGAAPLAERLPPTPPADDRAPSAPDADGEAEDAPPGPDEAPAAVADEEPDSGEADDDSAPADAPAEPAAGADVDGPAPVGRPAAGPPAPGPLGAPPPTVEMRHGVPVERVAPTEPAPAGPAGTPPARPASQPTDSLTGSFVGLDEVSEAEAEAAPGWEAPAGGGAEADRAPQRRPRWVGALLLLAVVVLSVLLVVWWSRRDRPADAEPAPEPVALAVDPAPPTDGPPPEAASAPDPDAPDPETAAPGGAVPDADAPGPPVAEPPARPERLAGLADADVRALAGGAVDPAAGGWTLVVFAARAPGPAEDQATRYREAGYRTGVVPAPSGGRTWYRTAIGQFASEADAVRLSDRLPPRAAAEAWAAPLRTP